MARGYTLDELLKMGAKPVAPMQQGGLTKQQLQQQGATFSNDDRDAMVNFYKAPQPKKGFLNKVGNLAKNVGGFLISNERMFGSGLSTLFDKTSQETVSQVAQQEQTGQRQLINAIQNEKDLVKKQHLADTLQRIYGQSYQPTAADLNAGFGLTNKQVIGSALGTALDIASFGSYGKAAKGAETGKLLVKPGGAVEKLAGKLGIPTSEAAVAKQVAKLTPKAAKSTVENIVKTSFENEWGKIEKGISTQGAFKGTQVLDESGKILPKFATGRINDIAEKLTSFFGENAANLFRGSVDASNATINSLSKATAKAVSQVTGETALSLGQKVAIFGKAFLQGAAKTTPIGVGYGTAGALEQDKSLKEVAKSGIQGGVINAIIGGLLEGRQQLKTITAPYEAQQLHEKAIAQYKKGLGATKEKYKELSDKVIPDLLKDKKWGTRGQLLQDAMSGVQLSEQQYEELGKLQGVAEVGGILDDINSRMDALKTPQGNILSINSGKYKALEGLKSDITDYILNDQVSKAGGPVAAQQALRELAGQYGDVLYETRKSLKTVSDSATLSQIQAVDAGIRDLLSTNNPTYAQINKVYSQSNRLLDVLNETAKRESTGLSTRHLIEKVSALVGSVGGLIFGSGGGTPEKIGGSLLGGAVLGGLATMVESTWWNTLRAVQKEKAAQKLLEFDPEKLGQTLIILARQGAKYAKQIGLY